MTAVTVGNVYDKQGSANPVARRLVRGFDRELDALLELAAPASVLDVGCGDGTTTARWAGRLAPARVVGLDLAAPRRPAAPHLSFVAGRAEALPFADGEFDLVAAVEALEHVAGPERALGEMARVARSHLLVSVPREPLWRALNVARGAYLRAAGNTPGHRHHWSRRGVLALLARFGEIVEVRSPLPWTMALVRVS